MVNCPCCSDVLLRHLSAGKLYFLCQGCKIQVPASEVMSDLDESEFLSSTPIVANTPSYDTASLEH